MDSLVELHQMILAVERRAAELKVPSVALIGLLNHCAAAQTFAMLRAAEKQSLITGNAAQQIMGGLREH